MVFSQEICGLQYEANAANQTKTYHFEQVGSTIARTDDAGKVIGRSSYSAYGLTTFTEGDMATPFRYNGQAGVITEKNGLLHMRARYYSPYLMRFLNADPIGFSGGSNWFAYADGNPISLSDPFGLCAQSGNSSGYVSPYDADGSVNWTGVGNYLYQAVAGVPSYVQENGARRFTDHITDPVFVATSALGGMGMGGVTGGLTKAANATVKAETFFIENGVRRSLVSQNAGLSEIPATIFRPGSAPTTTTLRLDQLMSPKTTVPLDSRYLNIQPPIHSPIQVQPFGLPNQPPSIPLRNVILD